MRLLVNLGKFYNFEGLALKNILLLPLRLQLFQLELRNSTFGEKLMLAIADFNLDSPSLLKLNTALVL